MKTTNPFAHDFSDISRGRLRTYHLLCEELERQAPQRISDADLDLIAAAGAPGIRPPWRDSQNPLIH